MINLLPPDYKKTIFYSRYNRTVIRWVFALALSLLFSLLIVGFGWIYLDQSIMRESKTAEESQSALNDQAVENTTEKVEEISSNTKLVLQVLSKEVLFSKLLRQLGASLPPDTALESINIEELSGGITIKALAKDFNSASQIQVNLEDPSNKIFKQADIESINCTESPETNLVYPCNVQLKALFTDDNEYVYIGATQ